MTVTRIACCFVAVMQLASCSKDAKKEKITQAPQPGSELEAVDLNPEPAALEEVMEVDEPVEPEPEPEPEVDETPIVSVLGYHDFTKSRRPTEMLMREDRFRKQMQMLKDANIPVISIDDFLAWRRKEAEIPKRCVIITADDGWREVHTYMMPIMKEFGYPYTVFLYTDFLDGGGRSLSQEQVEEIIASGGSIGSHSISHRDMNRVKLGKQSITFGRYGRMRSAYEKGLAEIEAGATIANVEGVKRSRSTIEAKLKELDAALAAYDEWITKELKESKEVLEAKFKVPIRSFAYPYGPYNDRIVGMALAMGYETLITVNGAKTNFKTPMGEIPRFIIHGGDDRNWKMATSFSGSSGLDAEGDLLKPEATEEGGPKETLIEVTPAEGELIADRQPIIKFDFTKIDGVEPSSLQMRVGGFGKVPATLEAKVLSWKVARMLRNDRCTVQVAFKQAGKQRRVNWAFAIEKQALYLPEYETKFPREEIEGTIPKAIPVGLPE